MVSSEGVSASTEWLVHGERSIYRSRWVDVRLADVEAPDGERFEHHVLRMQRVAVAVVVNEQRDQVLMLKRHRFIDGSWGWEVPVGIVEPGEESLRTAAREVLEETGWSPGQMTRLVEFQPAIGIADTPHEVFLAVGAEHVGEPTDITEAQDVAWVPVGDLLAMVNDGRVRDGATLVAVLHLLASRAGA
ncbi:NUDIX hydrolase [Nocardioides mesophilus]|uniref:NUDIX hydrolase n=1 Tax=Nocardioides mesophilus TaxID=433659 RepID=A0A7G9RGH3_9ACTN|nr:NUDIX hydrolase [Nocardioides mesophilus]QNN54698.1 NUDIX hydrolase [Nocardioides mesophilus]